MPASPDASKTPYCLRLTLAIVRNCPAPMVLNWGAERTCWFNQAYAELAGLRPESVPGGAVPTMQPAVFDSASAVVRAAWQGAEQAVAAQAVTMWRGGAPLRETLDLHYTPIADETGAVRGVLCAMRPANPAHVPAAPTGQRILVVEDNDDALFLVSEMLQTLGYAVDTAGSGEQALRRLAEQRCDILFTDVSLPGMSGLELARTVHAADPEVRIIFATGYGGALADQLGFAATAMQKPYDLAQLQQALASCRGE
jgi:CheY-like chemotaxis protein